MKIELSKLVENPNNIKPKQEAVEAMSKSLETAGQTGALTVLPVKGGKYMLIAGHTRLAAMRQLGWASAEAVMYEGSLPPDLAALVDNTVRRVPGTFEKAKAFSAARSAGETAEQIAARLGQSKSGVENYIRAYTKLPADLLEQWESGHRWAANMTRVMEVVAQKSHAKMREKAAELDAPPERTKPTAAQIREAMLALVEEPIEGLRPEQALAWVLGLVPSLEDAASLDVGNTEE